MHTKHCFTNYKKHKITWKSIKMLKYSHSWFHGIFIFLYQSTSGNNILECDAKCSRLSTDRDKSTTLMPRGYGNAIEGFIFFFIFTSCHKFNFRPTVPRTATMWYSSLWKSLAVLTQALRQRNPSQICCHSISVTVALTKFFYAQGQIPPHGLCHLKSGHGNFSQKKSTVKWSQKPKDVF